ncbi:MAG: hypothetical protein AB1505_24700 [Candidatus Latescibacterota bacterium]
MPSLDVWLANAFRASCDLYPSGGTTVLTYRAIYKYLEDGIHAEVLDFPGVITSAGDLGEARRLLASALVDMAETNLAAGEPLPRPDATATDPEADIEEPMHLILKAAWRVELVPQDVA